MKPGSRDEAYPPPLDRLFQMGEIEWGVEWQGTDPDYVAELGLTDQHVPALVAIARGQTELEDFPGAQPVLLALRYCLIVFMQRRASVVF